MASALCAVLSRPYSVRECRPAGEHSITVFCLLALPYIILM